MTKIDLCQCRLYSYLFFLMLFTLCFVSSQIHQLLSSSHFSMKSNFPFAGNVESFFARFYTSGKTFSAFPMNVCGTVAQPTAPDITLHNVVSLYSLHFSPHQNSALSVFATFDYLSFKLRQTKKKTKKRQYRSIYEYKQFRDLFYFIFDFFFSARAYFAFAVGLMKSFLFSIYLYSFIENKNRLSRLTVRNAMCISNASSKL